jgi:5-hydroxyisourate hydrolase
MAKLTSHTLNGSDGTHAGGIPVTLTNLNTGTVIFVAEMDMGGRLSQDIASDRVDPDTLFELVLDTGGYWKARNMPAAVTQIALRFAMHDPDGVYHMPVILNPNSYSMWTSA